MSKDYDDFQVGDTVYDVVSGKGTVTYIVSHGNYQIDVEFENGDSDSFTPDGRAFVGGSRTLFFSEPKVEGAVRRPFVPTLVGKTVVIHELGVECCIAEITEEYEDKIRYVVPGVSSQTYTSMRGKLVEIYEVTSENLLKKG